MKYKIKEKLFHIYNVNSFKIKLNKKKQTHFRLQNTNTLFGIKHPRLTRRTAYLGIERIGQRTALTRRAHVTHGADLHTAKVNILIARTRGSGCGGGGASDDRIQPLFDRRRGRAELTRLRFRAGWKNLQKCV
jgi:hypothetical protein